MYEKLSITGESKKISYENSDMQWWKPDVTTQNSTKSGELHLPDMGLARRVPLMLAVVPFQTVALRI